MRANIVGTLIVLGKCDFLPQESSHSARLMSVFFPMQIRPEAVQRKHEFLYDLVLQIFLTIYEYSRPDV